MNGPDRLPCGATLLAALLATPASVAALGDPNRALLATMMVSRTADQGCLPTHLGLGEAAYQQLVAEYFPGYCPGFTDIAPGTHPEPIPEWSDLQKLLLDHRARQRPSEAWIADVVATACAGHDHLWQDLGLLNREQLSQLMWENFPELARSNSGDMKWKKFLYHQFCSREGITVCRAPSCGECKDYAKCFGPEH
jgi:nitrogen fixation protein NifQ